MYYPYEDSFSFTVEETADITTPVDMTAFGDEVGISVSWGPIPAGCAEEAAAPGRASSQRIDRIQLKTKQGATEFVYYPNKKREINHVNPNQRNQGTTGPSLTRDCPDEQSTITMYQSGSSYNSEVTWEVKDSEDNLIASGSGNGSWEGCLPNGTYTVYG